MYQKARHKAPEGTLAHALEAKVEAAARAYGDRRGFEACALVNIPEDFFRVVVPDGDHPKVATFGLEDFARHGDLVEMIAAKMDAILEP